MINQILNQNIWWQDKRLISHDPKIREMNAQKFKWRPRVLEEFELDRFVVYTLRGPRQVGKTTALKILINDLLKKERVLKEQVMYYSCDNIDDYKELIELLETYLDYIKKLNLHKKRLYIFLDEVTSVRNWQKGIKYLVDAGKLSQAGIVLTGSNAADLRKGMERLPGRRGKTGGPEHEIGYAVYELYQQWLRGDISKAGRNERTARQIINELITIAVSAFGWETIAKKIGVATHKTVSEYMETMEDSFVLKTLYQIDINTRRPRVKKLKKAYFLDSFILWSLWGWVDNWLAYSDNVRRSLASADMKARLTEQVIANELFYQFDRP